MAQRAHAHDPEESPPREHGLRHYLKTLGPGIISGAADNDPTTVATVSVIGSTTIYRLSWLMVLVYPMLATVQVISARIGTVMGRGLQRVVVKEYGRAWGIVLLLSVVCVNTVTLAADLEAGAASLGLLFPLDYRWFIVPFAAGALLMLVLGSYNAVQRVLKVVLIVFVAYVFSAFAAHPNWGAVLHGTFVPSFSFDSTYVQGALALLGTTMTGYAYVWESIEEAEERPPIEELGLAQADAGIGMLLAVAVFWFILIGTGATLGTHHQTVQTAEDAARALVPIAGPIAGYLFAIGLLASAILAVPVLAATTAYVFGSEFGWVSGLSRRPTRAWRFYGILAASLALSVVIAFAGISPIRLLFVASIVGGLGTPISMCFLLLTARNRKLMGDKVIGRPLQVVGWATLTLISVIGLYFIWQQFAG